MSDSSSAHTPASSPDDILNFWFKEITPREWYFKDLQFDALIKDRFGVLYAAAVAGELKSWRQTSNGALAEIIILDQFSRNMYRDSPDAFAADSQAIELAKLAIEKGQDKEIKDPDQLAFLYMPFMHSESKEVHEMAVKLFKQPGLEQNYEFELKHKAIIDRFGRYPHRNQVLGRQSTPEEIEFLKEKDSSF